MIGRDYGRVIVDEQQMGHDALAFHAPGRPELPDCLLGILFGMLVVGSARVAWEVVRFRGHPTPSPYPLPPRIGERVG
jgi:hypothetical protein